MTQTTMEEMGFRGSNKFVKTNLQNKMKLDSIKKDKQTQHI